MPWVRLNATNFRDYIAPVEDVSPTNPNRGVFGASGDPEVCSADIVSGATHNTALHFYGFNWDNPYTTKKISGMRVTCIGRQDNPPTNTGWGFFQQAIANNVTIVTTQTGSIVSGIGNFYDYSGGVQLIAADLGGPVFYTSDIDFRRDTPREFEVLLPGTGIQETIIVQSGTSIYTPDQSQGEIGSGFADYYIDVFTDELPPEPVAMVSYPVYEMEKGWSFDGNYIPHFLELNWYWGDNPVDMTGLQKVRIHGLTKGFTKLQLAVNGMETDMLDYLPYYSEPQQIDLPRQPYFVNPDYEPVTNYTDTAARGLSVQMKFDGRNTDITRPEPSHVIQVLVIQSVPTGQRSH